MQNSKNIKIIVGLFYLVILFIFLYLLFSKFDLEEITTYKFIKLNREYLIGIKDSNIVLSSLVFMIFTFAALGLPGTSGFVGEFLVLVGVFQINIFVAVMASFGVILAAVYMLWLSKRVIFGKIINSEIKEMNDLGKVEIYIFASLIFLTIFFGIYPAPLFNTIDTSVTNLIDNYHSNLNFYLTEKNN